MRIAIPSFFWFPFAWHICFHPVTSSLYVSLGLKWISYRHHAHGSFSFNLMYLFKLEAPYFAVLWWFLPYIELNQPWEYMSCPSCNPYHFSPHPIPEGFPRTAALSAPCHASNFKWVIYFTYRDRHVSMLVSQTISPWPSPTVCESLFFISVSLLLPRICSHHDYLPNFRICTLRYSLGAFPSGMLHSA